MGRIALEEIIWDPSVYPRKKWNSATIDHYVDCRKGGAKFPACILEKGTNRLLDGKHRLEMEKSYVELWEVTDDAEWDADWPEPDGMMDVEYQTVPDGMPVKLYAAGLSAKHGDRITGADARALAREIYEGNPEYPQKTIAEVLSVSQQSISKYIRDLKAKKDEAVATKIGTLTRLGWTQEEVGEAVGVTQGRVAQILLEIPDLVKLIISRLQSGIPVEEVAEQSNISVPYAWALKLQGTEDDAERMASLGIKTQPYDVWQFPACLDGFGDEYPGRIPAQLIAHVLYFYTKPGDFVIDPMLGSGTTADVCLAMDRRCYGYDIANRYNRPYCIEHDIAQDGWPERTKKASLIFWDPPYFDKKDDTNEQDGYGEGSISKLDRDAYLAFFAKSFTKAYKIVKKGTVLAFLMSDWNDNEGKKPGIFIWDYADRLRKAGWTLERHIQVPLSTQQVHPDIVNKFRANRKLTRLERYLLIARK